MLTLSQMTETAAADLDALAAATENRQYSLALSRMAHAQRALLAGDRDLARKYALSARTAYTRALEDEHGQLSRVAAVQAVVVERGAAQDATKGKSVARNAQFTAHTFAWHDDASDK
jgi:hypothetical protein